MTPLEKIIIDKIKADGPMNMGEYMGLCLGHPEHGYYMTRDPFGVQGDFTTAPEISQIFGELIGAWIADCWMKLGCPDPFILLECGAGRGTLMADALRATKNVTSNGVRFHDALQVRLLEISPVLKDKQRSALSQFGGQYEPVWVDDMKAEAFEHPTIIIGNEFLDALPTRQMNFNGTNWLETIIDLDKNDTICLSEVKAEKELLALIPKLLVAPKVEDQVEVSLEQKTFIETLSSILINQGGSALFIDYGSIHLVPSDTIQAVKNHGFVDILERPGEVDITSHVQFAEIARISMENKLTVHGPVSQSDFLKRLGIDVRAGILMEHATPKQGQDLAVAVQRLTGHNIKENEMGALFKVIGLTADPLLTLEGLS